MGILDFQIFLQGCYDILRPGGVLLIVDGDRNVCGEDRKRITIEKEDEEVYLASKTVLP